MGQGCRIRVLEQKEPSSFYIPLVSIQIQGFVYDGIIKQHFLVEEFMILAEIQI